MKNEKGVTLISLIIYVILLTFIMAGASAVISSLYNNVNAYESDTKAATEIQKFNMYFVKDIKRENAKVTRNSRN